MKSRQIEYLVVCGWQCSQEVVRGDACVSPTLQCCEMLTQVSCCTCGCALLLHLSFNNGLRYEGSHDVFPKQGFTFHLFSPTTSRTIRCSNSNKHLHKDGNPETASCRLPGMHSHGGKGNCGTSRGCKDSRILCGKPNPPMRHRMQSGTGQPVDPLGTGVVIMNPRIHDRDDPVPETDPQAQVAKTKPKHP
jgi:hypothetical protein